MTTLPRCGGLPAHQASLPPQLFDVLADLAALTTGDG